MTRATKIRILFLLIVVVIGCSIYIFRPLQSAADRFQKAEELFQQEDFDSAERILRNLIADEEATVKVFQLAAECAIQRNDFLQAVKDFSRINREENQELWMDTRIQTAEILHYHLLRYRDAEQVYLEILAASENQIAANDGYARMLALCGRRSEAIRYIIRLIQLGESADLLVLLSRESVSISDPEILKRAHELNPEDPNPLLGLAQTAISTQQFEKALDYLLEAKQLNTLPESFQGKLGQQLLDANKDAFLDDWLNEVKLKSSSAESWQVMAHLAERNADLEGAIRCYWESLKLRPESLPALSQLAHKLNQINQPTLAEPFLKRVEAYNQLRNLQQTTIMAKAEPSIHDFVELIKAYYLVGRYWEAYGWSHVAFQIDSQNPELLQFLSELSPAIQHAPNLQTVPELNPALQVDLSHYHVPQITNLRLSKSESLLSHQISFVKQTSEIGMDFKYFNGSSDTTYRMYSFAGGGIAAIDYEKDGYPDMFFTQGYPWESSEERFSEYSDQLFRNMDGRRFEGLSVNRSSIFSSDRQNDQGFGQGVSTGDFNNDGFPDLYVANTGLNQLWMNNGDGTFSDQSFQLDSKQSAWTTSCLIADLNGDSFPDIYDVNYLEGENLFDQLCPGKKGHQIMCSPYDFDAAEDAIWRGDHQGQFQLKTRESLNVAPSGKGLGIVAFQPVGAGLSLFIANDTTANFFFVPDPNEKFLLVDRALETGLAFNGEGKAEACMGIAAEDYNQDGMLDLFVTNFLYESNTLYSQKEGMTYFDETRPTQLHEPSLPYLGFGTQSLDSNLDGNFEVFVNNGFTQNLSHEGTPYRMPPQFFEWTGSQFEQHREITLGRWLNNKQVGRSVMKLDWNLDLKADLVVGVLDEPSYILTNQSGLENRHGVKLSFVATASARDAIGTTVIASIDGRRRTYQLTAGDGYQCSNERNIIIGCGENEIIEQLDLHWPSGSHQTFNEIRTNQHLLCIENSTPLTLGSH